MDELLTFKGLTFKKVMVGAHIPIETETGGSCIPEPGVTLI